MISMSPQVAHFFGILSHQLQLPVLVLTVIAIVAAKWLGVRRARAAVAANQESVRRSRRAYKVTLSLAYVLTGLSGAAVLHIGCAAGLSASKRCTANVKMLALGALIYAQDYDERLAPVARWSHMIAPQHRNYDGTRKKYAKNIENPLECPDSQPPAGYGMNAALGGIPLSNIVDSENTVLFFDMNATSSSFSGGEKDVAWERHGKMPVMGFVDGHAKGIYPDMRDGLVWAVPVADK